MQGRFLVAVILGLTALGCENVAETTIVDAPGLYGLAGSQDGDGSYANPFGTLAELEAASSPGDTLYLLTSAVPFTDKIALKVGQKLIGIGADGLPGTTLLHGSDEHPVILLAGANEVANVSLQQLQGHGIAGVGVDLSGTVIHDVTFVGLVDARYEDSPQWAIYFEVNAGDITDVRVEDIVVRDAGAHGGIHVLHSGVSTGGYVFQRNRFDTLGGRALHTWSQNYSRIYTEFLDSTADNIGVGAKNADSILPHLSNRSQQDMLVKNYHYKNTQQVGSPSNTGIEAFIMGAPFPGEELWCDGCRLLLTIEDTVIQDSVTDGIQLTNFGSNSAFDIKIKNTQILQANPQQVGGGISLYAQNDKNTGSQTTLMVENSKVIDSQRYGVAVLDTGEGYTATVDLGGGALGSAGGNTITGSAVGEVQLIQATTVAKGNVWGIEPPRVDLQGDMSAIDLGQTAVADQHEACDSQQDMVFVCGPQNAEDLVRVDGTPWIIASGMSGEGIAGHMYLLDPANRSYAELYPGSSPQFRWDKDEFPSCPGELNIANFSAHGLAIRAVGGGMHRLYVTSHGAREAVEVFEVDARGEQPSVAWVGCVVMPEYASINSVAPLADGGFVTTRITGEGPQASGDIFAGDITGYLYEWHPGGAVTELAGTQMSGPNGVEVSPDGQMVYVASWGRGEVSRFQRTADGGLTIDQTAKMDFRVDNLRWSKRGTLYAVGHRLSQVQDCGGPLCMDEWEVAELDPTTMQARTLAVKKPIDGFTGATVAIDTDDGLWLGTFHGDRLVFIPQVTPLLSQ